MKVASAFVKPKGITKNSKCPHLVLKAVFGISLLATQTMIVIALKINFAEVLCSLKPVKEFFNMQQRVAILDSDFVQGPIIDAHAQGSLLLLD